MSIAVRACPDPGKIGARDLALTTVDHAIESAVHDSGVTDVEVGSFPAEAESVVGRTLKVP